MALSHYGSNYFAGNYYAANYYGPQEVAAQVIHPTGGEPLYKTEEEEVTMLIINSFLFMRNQDGRD